MNVLCPQLPKELWSMIIDINYRRACEFVKNKWKDCINLVNGEFHESIINHYFINGEYQSLEVDFKQYGWIEYNYRDLVRSHQSHHALSIYNTMLPFSSLAPSKNDELDDDMWYWNERIALPIRYNYSCGLDF